MTEILGGVVFEEKMQSLDPSEEDHLFVDKKYELSFSFDGVFGTSYQRNNKKGGKKHLRCFPCCGPNHKSSNACEVSITTTFSTGTDMLTTDRAYVAYGRFLPLENDGVTVAEDDLVDRLGDIEQGSFVKASVLSINERTPDSPFLPLYRGKLADQDQRHVTFEFKEKAWHYGWKGGRYKQNMHHILRIYILEGAKEFINCGRFRTEKDCEVRCVATLSSTPFTIYSSRSAPTKNQQGAANISKTKKKPSDPEVTGSQSADQVVKPEKKNVYIPSSNLYTIPQQGQKWNENYNQPVAPSPYVEQYDDEPGTSRKRRRTAQNRPPLHVDAYYPYEKRLNEERAPNDGQFVLSPRFAYGSEYTQSPQTDTMGSPESSNEPDRASYEDYSNTQPMQFEGVGAGFFDYPTNDAGFMEEVAFLCDNSNERVAQHQHSTRSIDSQDISLLAPKPAPDNGGSTRSLASLSIPMPDENLQEFVFQNDDQIMESEYDARLYNQTQPIFKSQHKEPETVKPASTTTKRSTLGENENDDSGAYAAGTCAVAVGAGAALNNKATPNSSILQMKSLKEERETRLERQEPPTAPPKKTVEEDCEQLEVHESEVVELQPSVHVSSNAGGDDPGQIHMAIPVDESETNTCGKLMFRSLTRHPCLVLACICFLIILVLMGIRFSIKLPRVQTIDPKCLTATDVLVPSVQPTLKLGPTPTPLPRPGPRPTGTKPPLRGDKQKGDKLSTGDKQGSDGGKKSNRDENGETFSGGGNVGESNFFGGLRPFHGYELDSLSEVSRVLGRVDSGRMLQGSVPTNCPAALKRLKSQTLDLARAISQRRRLNAAMISLSVVIVVCLAYEVGRHLWLKRQLREETRRRAEEQQNLIRGASTAPSNSFPQATAIELSNVTIEPVSSNNLTSSS